MNFIDRFKNKIERTLKIYNDEDYIEMEDVIIKNFGKYKKVYHDNYPENIQIDIYIINPNKDRNYYTLITCGLGAYTMQVDANEFEDQKEISNAELVLYLPKSWKLNDKTGEGYWALNLLKNVAKIPIDNFTWIGPGHTINLIYPFTENTEQNSVLLLNTLSKENNKLITKLPSGKTINFYTVIPLYEEECNLKLKKGAERLLKLFEKNNLNYPPVLNLKRKNFCKK